MSRNAHLEDSSGVSPDRRILLLRAGLPSLIALAGVVLLIIGGSMNVGLGVTLIGVAFLVVLINAFVRLSFASENDRDKEEAARDYFTRTGRWPQDR